MFFKNINKKNKEQIKRLQRLKTKKRLCQCVTKKKEVSENKKKIKSLFVTPSITKKKT